MFAKLSSRVIPRLATQVRCVSSLNGMNLCFSMILKVLY